ncbi:MAG: RNA methyltransferase [Deltaproteobacteria bacterium]|nr:RNA methyltransferase [Deltaproteobacteria bacterium]
MAAVSFILVRPEYPGNIGQAARAIANFGFHDLRLVAPAHPPTHKEAMKYAMKAAPLLTGARVTKTLLEATRDCHYLIGTSRRLRKTRKSFHSLHELDEILSDIRRPRQKIGILFGPETKGLDNEALALCHTVVTIPTDPQCPSINLAHAVAIVAYELARACKTTQLPAVKRRPRPATADLTEGMFAKLEAVLEAIGFFKQGSRRKVLEQLHYLFNRAVPTYHEAQILWAVWQKVLWRLSTSPRKEDA